MSDEIITIVSGLPRSGTSLMMQMIDAGGVPALTDHVRSQDEDNPRGYYELEAVKKTRSDPTWLARARGRVVKLVHLLLYDLPDAHSYRVVFMRRDLSEVVRSQAVMLERRGTEGADLSADQLIKAFEGQLDKVQKWLGERPNFEVLYVNYNELVADPGPAAAAINGFLGGGLDESAMLAAVDPSLYRQRHSAQGAT